MYANPLSLLLMPRPAWRTGYRANRLPTPLWAPVLAPVALELSRVLERVSGDHAGVANLRVVERAISRPGSSFDQVSDGVLRLALAELRWIAARTRPTPAMARLLDQLQRLMENLQAGVPTVMMMPGGQQGQQLSSELARMMQRQQELLQQSFNAQRGQQPGGQQDGMGEGEMGQGNQGEGMGNGPGSGAFGQ